MPKDTIKVVKKTLNVLELLIGARASRRTLTLSMIKDLTGYPLATSRNILRTLEECEYATRVSHGHYQIGPKVEGLFESRDVVERLREIALPKILKFKETLKDNVVLTSIINNRRVELAREMYESDMKSPGEHELWALELRASSELYAMASTRVLLAWMVEDELKDFLEVHGFPTETDWPECFGRQGNLTYELSRIKRFGGVIQKTGNMTLYAIAVPVFSKGGNIIAALGCYSRTSKTDNIRANGIFKILQDFAREIEKEL